MLVSVKGAFKSLLGDGGHPTSQRASVHLFEEATAFSLEMALSLLLPSLSFFPTLWQLQPK